MTHTKAKKIGRIKGKSRVRMSKKLTRSREFYSCRYGMSMIAVLRRRLRKRKGAGDTTVPEDLFNMTMDTLLTSFIQCGKDTRIEKALMNIDCSTGEARWVDGALCS